MRYRLHWTQHAILHIAAHGLLPSDVEEALEGPIYTRREADKTLALGHSHRGTLLIVLVASPSRRGFAEVVTARLATLAERRLFWKRRK